LQTLADFLTIQVRNEWRNEKSNLLSAYKHYTKVGSRRLG
jgi:hypothetical protein